MHVIPIALTVLGRHGPMLLVLSLVTGLVAAPLSAAAQTLVPELAFLLTLGSFLSAALSPREAAGARRLVPFALAFVGLGVPAVVYSALQVMRLGPATELAILVASLAPPVGSAAAIAAMLGLRLRLALIVSILLTLAAPLIMPTALALGGFAVSVDFGRVAVRLSRDCRAGGASQRARAALAHTWSVVILPDAQAAAGVSVVGLAIVGLAVTHGVAPLVGDVARLWSLPALSAATNVGLLLLGAFIFLPVGQQEALTVGLLAGNRNVTLTWAVAGPSFALGCPGLSGDLRDPRPHPAAPAQADLGAAIRAPPQGRCDHEQARLGSVAVASPPPPCRPARSPARRSSPCQGQLSRHIILFLGFGAHRPGPRLRASRRHRRPCPRRKERRSWRPPFLTRWGWLRQTCCAVQSISQPATAGSLRC